MITDIEEKSLELLASKIAGIRKTGIQKNASTQLANPSFSAAVLDGEFEKSVKGEWKQKLTLSILITFKNMHGEEARRKGINPLVEAVILTLIGQKLGLAIDEIYPIRFNDVTTEADAVGGMIKYLVQLGTAYTIRKQDDEESEDLLGIAARYFLEPGDDKVDAEDETPTEET
jgi:hypothetical protein